MRSFWRTVFENLMTAMAYWGISWINFLLFQRAGVLPMPIWPAAALALVAAVQRGWLIAPGIALGTVLANHFALGSSWLLACGIAVMNTIGPLIAAGIINHRVTRQLKVRSLIDGVVCFLAAVLLAPALTATGGIGTKYLLSLISAEALAPAWTKWASAHAAGTFFLALPVFIFLHDRKDGLQGKALRNAARQVIPIAAASCLLLSLFFWVADALFFYLWFPEQGSNLLAVLVPTDNYHILFIRLFTVLIFMMCTTVVARVVSSLLIQQHEARRMAEHLSITLNSIGDGVISTDAQGRVDRMNPIAERLTGWSQKDACGLTMQDVFHIVNAESRKVVVNPVEKVLENEEIVGLANHTILVARDGTEYQITDSAAPIKNRNGKIMGVILVFRDMTGEYALQEQLQHSQRMDAIGQLAGGVAHDFNNMLGGITGAAEVIQSELEAEGTLGEMIRIILESSNRAAGLTRKLLAFARRQHAVLTVIDIHDSVREAIALLENTIDRRVRIMQDLSANDSHVIGDATQLQSAFINLGINAAHAMPNGGSLKIISREVELDPHYCQACPFDIDAGSYMELEFRDTGCGIAPEHLSKIFEPFFTTKPQGAGTGLGLSAVYGTIQQHKGAINIYSEVGRGTSFRIYLPLCRAERSHNDASEARELISGKGRILVVDDEAVLRYTTQAMLENLGYEVLLAENGQEGVDIFREEYRSIDLVIVDMIMPVMNGRDCFAELKRINPDVRVLLASGFSQKEDVKMMETLGLCGFLCKPFRNAELSQAVYEALAD